MYFFQVTQLQGHVLKNGHFIFYWRNEGYWKLVLTNNQGVLVINLFNFYLQQSIELEAK